MRIAALFGHPVAHSRSPLVHGVWLARHGLSGAYLRRDVPPDEIDAVLARLDADGYVGGNVTIPHKEAALAAADEASDRAHAIGAANTLWLDGGRLHADNTDVDGFLGNLDAGAPGWDGRRPIAVVVGAGGAARAILYGLIARGFDRIRLANRTRARADALAAAFGPKVRPIDWDELPHALAEAALLVNTTSLGLKGETDLDLDLAALPADAVVTDAVYVPRVTGLLARAAARDLATVDGLGMLLHQAAPGFERWFGVRPAVDSSLIALVAADLERR